MAEQQPALYRFYKLGADDHIAVRHEDYFANDAAAIGAAGSVIDDYSSVEIWCELRKIANLSREEALLQQTKKDI